MHSLVTLEPVTSIVASKGATASCICVNQLKIAAVVKKRLFLFVHYSNEWIYDKVSPVHLVHAVFSHFDGAGIAAARYSGVFGVGGQDALSRVQA